VRGDPRGRKVVIPALADLWTNLCSRAAYARREAIVEPVFGQMHTLQNGIHLLLRGIDGARGEWLLLAACHNLRKLHTRIGTDGLAALATS
jgi:hypothetical protein